MECPKCQRQLIPNLSLESDWQVVECVDALDSEGKVIRKGCGAKVEIGHGDPIIWLPATVEDFHEAAARFKWYDDIYWRRYGPVYQRLDFEFWEQVKKENRPPEPPSEAAKDLQDIKGELAYIKEKVSSLSVNKKKEKGIY